MLIRGFDNHVMGKNGKKMPRQLTSYGRCCIWLIIHTGLYVRRTPLLPRVFLRSSNKTFSSSVRSALDASCFKVLIMVARVCGSKLIHASSCFGTGFLSCIK